MSNTAQMKMEKPAEFNADLAQVIADLNTSAARRGAAPAWAAHAPQNSRKSTRLGLLFPYDWSNPSIRDEALILNVLERGIYRDICRVCAHFGLAAVERLLPCLPRAAASSPSLARMLNNIRKGFARAQTRQSS
ncbi:MAG: hypothetical protein LBU11_01165 [Zoogloeaceae bacterium]|jgi:hypothetical protein|nr:hypothetical protein [Zoogloeaceae bacterium]